MAFEQSILVNLAATHGYQNCTAVEKIPQSGSNRLYFRLLFDDKPSIIGVYNQDVKENEAFFYFTRFFLEKNIPVPEIYAIDKNKNYYLLEDLGDESLFSYLSQHREGEHLPEHVLSYYEKVIKQLPLLQLSGTQGMDFNICYPREAFDRQSMQWDLNYFKYYFLKLVQIPFDEQLLENDFNTLISFLLEADNHYFMFRDFQSRNIMIRDEHVFFIDYQGGRKGALQYDIASLLYDGKADISPEIRTQLLEVYLDELQKYIPVNRHLFKQHYQGFVLIRILQALGTYGFRGYYEKKSHFLLSIPFAIRNISYLLDRLDMPIQIPALLGILKNITQSEFANHNRPNDKLTVTVTSFSYKKGIPQDYTVNGGGFVFDCRALPNPGREKQYMMHTGKEKIISDYLNKYPEVSRFKENVFSLIDASVDNYLERKFSNLMVNFGCTGGQHRSVYFAESLAAHLVEKYHEKLNIVLKHTNLNQ